MPTPRLSKHFPNSIYFSTLTVIEWIDIFTKHVYFDVLIDSLKFCQKEKALMLYGHVFMTNHIHLLFSVDEESSAEVFMRDFKKWTTNAIQNELKNESRRYIKNLLDKTIFKKRQNRFQVWQANNFSEIVESKPFFKQKLEYIHWNPVKKGYVNSVEDWKYSSARNWMYEDHSVINVVLTEL